MNKQELIKLGEKLANARKLAGHQNVQKFSELIGISRQRIYSAEAGKKVKVDSELVRAYCTALKMGMDYFIEGYSPALIGEEVMLLRNRLEEMETELAKEIAGHRDQIEQLHTSYLMLFTELKEKGIISFSNNQIAEPKTTKAS